MPLSARAKLRKSCLLVAAQTDDKTEHVSQSRVLGREPSRGKIAHPVMGIQMSGACLSGEGDSLFRQQFLKRRQPTLIIAGE
jgi:hypothetical protein